MKYKAVIIISLSVFMLGCSKDPTIDARGDEDQRAASIQHVKDSLDSDQVDDFEEALRTLLFADVNDFTDLADGEGIARRFEDRVHGLTADEVVTESKRILELKEEMGRQETLKKIEELAEKLKKDADNPVSNFVVQRARLRQNDESGYSRNLTIEITVINDTEHAVSRAYFHAMLLTPGREIPWVNEEFNYEIPGGLEPGEQAAWFLSPNMFGKWSSTPSDRFDTVFIVRATQIDGADGSPIGGERFTTHEEEQLADFLNVVDGYAEDVQGLLENYHADLQQWQRDEMQSEAIREFNELWDARDQLGKVRIIKTRLEERTSGYSRENVIEVLVENGSPSLLEWIRGNLKIISPDRQVPWDDEEFYGIIRPALEPGEQAWVILRESSDYGLGRWSFPPEEVEANAVIVVESVEAPEGVAPYEVEFTVQDQERLDAIDSMIRAQGWD